MVCHGVRPNDHLVLIAGCTAPMIIREADLVQTERIQDDKTARFRLVGSAFISPEFDGGLRPDHDGLVEIALG